MAHNLRGYAFLRHRRRFSWPKTVEYQNPSIPPVQFLQHVFIIAFICILSSPTCTDALSYHGESHIGRSPVFLNSNQNITARAGAKVELPCIIQNLGTKQVAWRSVDRDVFLTIGTMAWSPGTKYLVKHKRMSEHVDDWTLVIPQVQPSDGGQYECQLTTVSGLSTHIQLTVAGEAVRTTAGPPLTAPALTLTGEKFVEKGSPILLTCNATGGSQIAEAIDWFLDGDIISPLKYKQYRYIIYTYSKPEEDALTSTLQVDRAGPEHSGTYVCRSSHGKLADLVLQVLVADRDNVKRGTEMQISSTDNAFHRLSAHWTVIYCVVVCGISLQSALLNRPLV